jgi:hypothetical protein
MNRAPKKIFLENHFLQYFRRLILNLRIILHLYFADVRNFVLESLCPAVTAIAEMTIEVENWRNRLLEKFYTSLSKETGENFVENCRKITLA